MGIRNFTKNGHARSFVDRFLISLQEKMPQVPLHMAIRNDFRFEPLMTLFFKHLCVKKSHWDHIETQTF